MMTERAAAIKANKIYALWATLDYEARCANVNDFLTALDKMSVYFSSAAQMHKHLDFIENARSNYCKKAA